jgi:hypothetical protein
VLEFHATHLSPEPDTFLKHKGKPSPLPPPLLPLQSRTSQWLAWSPWSPNKDLLYMLWSIWISLTTRPRLQGELIPFQGQRLNSIFPSECLFDELPRFAILTLLIANRRLVAVHLHKRSSYYRDPSISLSHHACKARRGGSL